MEGDDWDLYAVVRGCSAAISTTTTAAVNLPSHDQQNSLFGFPGAVVDHRNDSVESLHEIYQSMCGVKRPPPPPAVISLPPPPPRPPVPLPPQQDTLMQMKPPLRFNMQVQQNLDFNVAPPPPPLNLPAATPQPAVRPRRRKNQQVKMVREMTQEEISADSWAWRKYGQKPIKGSPYPRNYYRCSTSKGCAARKQVERSSHDPEIFIVTYSGEHTHPRPTHRSSLAGSTRSKLASQQPKGRAAALSQKYSMAASSSSPSAAAASSFSPDTPLMKGEASAQNNEDLQMAEEDDIAADEEEDNVIMIPGDMVNDDDDMFAGFQDSDDHSSGGAGNLFSGDMLSSPPWTPNSSGGTFNGGGR